MRIAAVLLFWLPLGLVIYRFARGWRSWWDFVQVAVASAVAVGTDRYWETTPVRALSLAVSGAVAGAAMLWALGPGSLPDGGPAVTRGARGRGTLRCPLCMIALILSLASVVTWTVDGLPVVAGVLLSAASVASASLAVIAWLRRSRET